jgi:hypothetical protein
MPSGAKHQCSIVIEGHHVSLLGGLAATVLHRARCRGGIQTSDPLVAVSMGEGCTVRVLDVTESP